MMMKGEKKELKIMKINILKSILEMKKNCSKKDT
jgi:hypothetical protein